jgi:hypothetical protein
MVICRFVGNGPTSMYSRQKRVTPELDDAPDFAWLVERVANGVIRRHAPETLVLIKIDN